MKRNYLVRASLLDDGSRHPIDHRGGGVLGKHGATPGLDLRGALSAINAHAGEDDGEKVLAENARGALKRHVERGPNSVNGRLSIEVDAYFTRYDEMIVAGRHERDVRDKRLVLHRFAHGKTRFSVQPPGQRPSKGLRHVLNADHRGVKRSSQPRNDIAESGRPAGGRTDHHQMGRGPCTWRRGVRGWGVINP